MIEERGMRWVFERWLRSFRGMSYMTFWNGCTCIIINIKPCIGCSIRRYLQSVSRFSRTVMVGNALGRHRIEGWLARKELNDLRGPRQGWWPEIRVTGRRPQYFCTPFSENTMPSAWYIPSIRCKALQNLNINYQSALRHRESISKKLKPEFPHRPHSLETGRACAGKSLSTLSVFLDKVRKEKVLTSQPWARYPKSVHMYT